MEQEQEPEPRSSKSTTCHLLRIEGVELHVGIRTEESWWRTWHAVANSEQRESTLCLLCTHPSLVIVTLTLCTRLSLATAITSCFCLLLFVRYYSMLLYDTTNTTTTSYVKPILLLLKYYFYTSTSTNTIEYY